MIENSVLQRTYTLCRKMFQVCLRVFDYNNPNLQISVWPNLVHPRL